MPAGSFGRCTRRTPSSGTLAEKPGAPWEAHLWPAELCPLGLPPLWAMSYVCVNIRNLLVDLLQLSLQSPGSEMG